jgi:hypothetical protein
MPATNQKAQRNNSFFFNLFIFSESDEQCVKQRQKQLQLEAMAA